MRLEAAILEGHQLFTGKFKVEERQMVTNYYLEITIHFPNNNHKLRETLLTCQQYRFTLGGSSQYGRR